MLFFFWKTSDEKYIGLLNILYWTEELQQNLDEWVDKNASTSISYGDGLIEFQHINDFTAFRLAWT